MTQTKKVNLMFLVTVIVFLCGTVLLQLVYSVISIPVAIRLLLSEGILLGGPFICIKLGGFRVAYGNRKNGMGSWSLLCLIGITICMSPLISLANMISSRIAGNAVEDVLTATMDIPLVLRILLFAVWPAMVEEYVFRGLFFRGLRRHGLIKAALASALFFGLIHLNFNQFSYAFIAGFVMAFAVEATGTLHASVTIHICMNLPSVLLTEAVMRYPDQPAGAFAAFRLLSASAQATSEYGYLNSPAYMAMTVMVIVFLAALGTPLVVVLMKKLIRLNEREDYMSWVLKGGEAQALSRYPAEKMVDVFFISGVGVCLACMIAALFR